MRRLFLGGSFNPIHHGHLLCGLAAAEKLGFDRLVLVPSAQPPLKRPAADLASAAERMAMCELAAAGIAAIEVEAIESQRNGPSFTIETARELKRRGAESVNWLIGTDNLRDLPLWHDLPGLLQEVEFTVMARAGWTPDWNAMPAELRQLESRLVTVPQIEISSTNIRRRVAAGLPIDFLTPSAVCNYIREHGLYKRA